MAAATWIGFGLNLSDRRQLQATADDEAFGRQPAPVVGPVPPNLSKDGVTGTLQRAWLRALASGAWEARGLMG